jgi:hypothetical protein
LGARHSEAPFFTLSTQLPSQEAPDLRTQGEIQIPVKVYRKAGVQGGISMKSDIPGISWLG